ncbi:class I SAM-dependent methyltransferase [Daejeonella sp.]|jgi:ubiquinone/menaquinone biosynthesis C-methylase UbiE|uniref:class I SAM-dependent methyltransferase n=1 Tax=Daejeonella sp. TaxID=2805397 RepID=UPI0037BF7A6C
MSLSFKEFFELGYWKIVKLLSKNLNNNSHYKYFYTSNFALSEEFYKDKIILDIGCGPRGSLEWAEMAKERIGLDPLAEQYIKMGAKDHKMTYIKAYVENIPFPDNYFDVICSFNSLDHVDNLETACKEIKRTLKKNGLFLLMVDIHTLPTLTEPQTMSWNFINEQFPEFEIIEEKHLERTETYKIYTNVRNSKPVDDSSKKGVLTAKIKKKK